MSLSIAQGFKPKPITFKGSSPAKSNENLAFKASNVDKLNIEGVLTPNTLEKLSKLPEEKKEKVLENLLHKAGVVPEKIKEAAKKIKEEVLKFQKGEKTLTECLKSSLAIGKEAGAQNMGCIVLAAMFIVAGTGVTGLAALGAGFLGVLFLLGGVALLNASDNEKGASGVSTALGGLA